MKQLTVITANQVGDLATIAGVLADEGINIENVEADAHGDRSVVVLNVLPEVYDAALQVLQAQAQFQVVTEDAIVVRIEDRPGALAEIALRFNNAALNLRSIHIIQRDGEHSLASIVAEDREKALTLLGDVLA